MEESKAHLSNSDFLEIIERTPLVSIDLIIRNSENKILMGLRTNQPAKGFWFVPGGRILKDERVSDAFERITQKELNEKIELTTARLINVYDHLYDSNFFDKNGVSTHYVVLAFELKEKDIKIKNIIKSHDEQHKEFKWISVDQAKIEGVHENSKEYFNQTNTLTETQYQALNSRRDSFNNLVWQTPVLSLTAQAFLFTIIYASNALDVARTIIAMLSIVLALASIQLLMKHRFMEGEHAKLLHEYEVLSKQREINKKFESDSVLLRYSSYKIWMFALISVLLGAVAAILLIWIE